MSTSSELGKNVRGLQRRGCYPMNLWRGWMRGGLGWWREGVALYQIVDDKLGTFRAELTLFEQNYPCKASFFQIPQIDRRTTSFKVPKAGNQGSLISSPTHAVLPPLLFQPQSRNSRLTSLCRCRKPRSCLLRARAMIQKGPLRR